MPLARPKLVVGIVVDQMRYDYLYRYYDKYTQGGFRRLMQEGFNCRNNHYHYAATYTGPGHAHIYSGSTPALSGIVSNEWFDQGLGRPVYCTEDSTVQTVGNAFTTGKMSPRNLLVTTVTDQLKLVSPASKVVGIALKDRGAILPAGHAANAAYWFDSRDGNWISSTFYMKDLPQWAKEFNNRQMAAGYMNQKWETLLPLDQYTESDPDDGPYEVSLPGEEKPVFPHSFAADRGGKYEVLRTTPFGDLITKEFALAALKGEQMGRDNITDFLCVSFSTPDYVGHAFGPHSVEMEDTYLRLDRQLAEMLNTLDAYVGRGQYVVFLSADHGVADIPGFMQQNRIPAGALTYGQLREAMDGHLQQVFGSGSYVRSYMNQQVYLNQQTLTEKKLSVAQVFDALKPFLLKQKAVLNVVSFHDMNRSLVPDYQAYLLKNVYMPRRSGDFYVVYEPGWFEGRPKGTTHGTLYNYDTHVPLLFYGWGVPAGETNRRTHIHDIAPTVAALLRILEPNGCIGNPIVEIVK